MKTFDEAISQVLAYAETPKEAETIKARFNDYSARFKGLAEEVENNPSFIIILTWHLSLCSSEQAAANAFFSMFMMGLTTGIEMEKQELKEDAPSA